MSGMKCLKQMIVLIALSILLLLPACSLFKKNREHLRRFAAEFETIQARYALESDVTLLKPEQTSALKEKSEQLNALLTKYKKLLPADDGEAELLRSKVMLEMSDFSGARRKIDLLMSGDSAIAAEARMLNVLLLVRSGSGDRALRLFRQIEAAVPPGLFLYDAWLHFALYGDDNALETFGKKLLADAKLPEKFKRYRSVLYRRLAALARRQGKLENARALLEDAVKSAPDEQMVVLAQAESARLDFIGKPANALTAEAWFNAPRPAFPVVQGKPVVVVFWAPWCHSSHHLLLSLQNVYDTFKKKGLVVIGYTRLYGFFRDGSQRVDSLSRQDELAAIKEYIEENRLTFPIAVSNEGYGYESYNITALPTLVLINRNGYVTDTVTGSGQFQTLEKQITQLLEEI